jgi:hypothetical protein
LAIVSGAEVMYWIAEDDFWVAGIVLVVSGSWESLWLLSCRARRVGFGGPLGGDASHGGYGDGLSNLSIDTEVVAASESAQSVTASLSSDFWMTESVGLWPVQGVGFCFSELFERQ